MGDEEWRPSVTWCGWRWRRERRRPDESQLSFCPTPHLFPRPMSSQKTQTGGETATFTVKAGLAQMLKGARSRGTWHAPRRRRESSK